jgi:4-amino-4-deoxy-L-arabinose transferase-like glycosyltransferase
MMALNIETIAWARIGVSDMLLTGCMGAALLAFFLGYIQQDPLTNDSSNPNSNSNAKKATTNLWYLAFYIFIALAILAKGPVGIVLPGLIILLFLLYVGQGLGQFWSVIQEMKPIRGLLIILAIALPWYLFVTWANGEAYLNSFFGYHNFERFTNVVNKHSAPWYFYFIVVLMGFAPWSLYLPVAIARLKWWQRNYWQRQPRIQHLGLFALAWFVGIFGFFTVAATKLPSYVLPLMPAAAILVALLFTSNYPQSDPVPPLLRGVRGDPPPIPDGVQKGGDLPQVSRNQS